MLDENMVDENMVEEWLDRTVIENSEATNESFGTEPEVVNEFNNQFLPITNSHTTTVIPDRINNLYSPPSQLSNLTYSTLSSSRISSDTYSLTACT